MISLKQLLYTIIIGLSFCFNIYGQKNENAFQKIEAQKIAYVTKYLKLSSSETQLFYPAYDQYREEIKNLKSAKLLAKQSFSPNNSDVIEFDAREVEIKKHYRKKFSEILGQSRASQFFVVEEEFNDLLYQEWRKRNLKLIK